MEDMVLDTALILLDMVMDILVMAMDMVLAMAPMDMESVTLRLNQVRCSLWSLWRVWLWTWTPCLLPGIWTWIWLWAWIWILWLNYLIQQIRSGIKMAKFPGNVLWPEYFS